MVTPNTTMFYRADGALVCTWDGNPYSVTAESNPKNWEEIQSYLAAHPEALVPEPTPPEPSPAALTAQARDARDAALQASDWTQVADAPVDKAVWAGYRQALRDWPEGDHFPDIGTMPVKP